MSENAETHTLSSLCKEEMQTMEQLVNQSKTETKELLDTLNQLIDQSLSAINDWDETFKELNQELLNCQTNQEPIPTVTKYDEENMQDDESNLKLKDTDVDILQNTENEPTNEYYLNYMDANITENRVFGPKQQYSKQDYLKELILDNNIDIFKKTIMVTLHEKSISEQTALFDATCIEDKEKQIILQDITIFLERYNNLQWIDWVKNLLNIKDIKQIKPKSKIIEQEVVEENRRKEEQENNKRKLFLKRLEDNLDLLTFNKFQYKLFHESAYTSQDIDPPPNNINIINISNMVGTMENQEGEAIPKSVTNIQANGKPEHMDQQLYDLFFKPYRSNRKESDIANNYNIQIKELKWTQQGNTKICKPEYK